MRFEITYTEHNTTQYYTTYVYDIRYTGFQPTDKINLKIFGLIVAAFILLCCFITFYFTSQPSKHEMVKSLQFHGLMRTKNTFRAYLFGHSILFYGLFILGVGIGLNSVILHNHTENTKDFNKHDLNHQLANYFSTIPLAFILVGLHIIKYTHFDKYHRPKWVAKVRFLLIVAIIILPVTLWKTVDNFVLGCIVGACVLADLFICARGEPLDANEIEKEEHIRREAFRLIRKQINYNRVPPPDPSKVVQKL